MSAWRRIGLNITRCGDWPTSCMIRRPKPFPLRALPAPSPSRSEPFPLRTAPDHGLSNAGGNVDNKVFISSSRPQVGAQGAEECLHLLAPHFAHVHEMSFRIKYLCAVAIKPSSNHQKKLANVSIAAYFLLGLAIAPDMWASRPLGCSARRPRYRARSGLLRRCTPARVPVEQAQSRSGPLNQLTKFFARFEERNSLRWHLDPTAGLWIASRAATPLSRVEGAEPPNLPPVAGSQGTDDAVQYRADDDVRLLQG